MKKVLITGISGFAGSHLAEYLLPQQTAEIYGTYLTHATHTNLAVIEDKITLKKADLTKFDEVEQLLSDIRPDEVYHLAAFPSPAQSFKDPARFLHNNIDAELYILEALKSQNMKDTKVVIVSSSEVYGLVKPDELPIDEETPLNPVSPYGVSKIAQDFLALQYFNAYHIPVIRVRPFGHIGPRLSDQFVASAFSKKIAEIEKGQREKVLTVGNLDARRDLTDVRDMVRAYALAMEKGVPGDVYNIGSGKSYQIKEILDTLLRMSKVQVEVKTDPELLRPNDIPELRCNNSKFVSLTDWSPTIPLEKSLSDTLMFWRQSI